MDSTKTKRVYFLIIDLLRIHEPVPKLFSVGLGQVVRIGSSASQIPARQHLLQNRTDLFFSQRQRRGLPHEASRRKMLNIGGIDATIAERFNKSGTISILIIPHEIRI